jgi:long-chain acyl-CoA synthetase
MYVTALIVPDLIELKNLARNTGIEGENESRLITNSELINKIEKDINYIQKHLSPHEKVRKFTLLEKPFSIEAGELTPTLKIKRKVVEEKYKDIIDGMYHKI